MSADRFSGYAASLNGGSLYLTQVDDQSVAPGNSYDEIYTAGMVDRGTVILGKAQPMVTLSSTDITTIFTTVSASTGYACSSASLFQFQKRFDGGVFAGAGNHTTFSAAKGFLCPVSISAQANQQAKCQLKFYALFNGSTFPLAAANSQNLSGAGSSITSTFYLGPLYVNGTQIEGLTSATMDFGLEFTSIYADGNIFPREGMIVKRSPRMSLTFSKASIAAANFANMFNTAAAGTVSLYLVKGTQGSQRIAYNSANNALISFAAGSGAPNQIQVGGEGDASITVDLYPTGSGAVSVGVTSQLPAQVNMT